MSSLPPPDLRRSDALARQIHIVLRTAALALGIIALITAVQRHGEMMEVLGGINRSLERIVPPEGKAPQP